MSRFFSSRYDALEPYVPGEQPQNREYIKLNTNESPFPPSPGAQAMAAEAIARLQLYPDPACADLCRSLSSLINEKEKVSTSAGNVIVTNGSDEVLNFAFMAFCDENRPAVFPDITYGFYPVFAKVNNVGYREVPLDEEFRIDPEDYENAGGTIFIANPNAHTGIELGRDAIEGIIRSNRDNMVIVDEAYVDFGAESCIPLIEKYDNLLVVQTFSKSRSLAGARLGFGIAAESIIRDLDTVRNSTNPYNINGMSMAAGIGAIEDEEYTAANCRRIIENREYTARALADMGFEMTGSVGNFVFIKHPDAAGEAIYEGLRRRGVLVRHFTNERIAEYNRVTIGSREQMDKFISVLREVLEELK